MLEWDCVSKLLFSESQSLGDTDRPIHQRQIPEFKLVSSLEVNDVVTYIFVHVSFAVHTVTKTSKVLSRAAKTICHVITYIIRKAASKPANLLAVQSSKP